MLCLKKLLSSIIIETIHVDTSTVQYLAHMVPGLGNNQTCMLWFNFIIGAIIISFVSNTPTLLIHKKMKNNDRAQSKI